jgi:hypothetical protein
MMQDLRMRQTLANRNSLNRNNRGTNPRARLRARA